MTLLLCMSIRRRLMAAARALLLKRIALLCAARLLARSLKWALLLAIHCLLIIIALRRAANARLLAKMDLFLRAIAALLRASMIALRLLANHILRYRIARARQALTARALLRAIILARAYRLLIIIAR